MTGRYERPAPDGDAGGDPGDGPTAVAARLSTAAQAYEPDRELIWGRVSRGMADGGHGPRRIAYAWPLAGAATAAAAAAVVIFAVNGLGGPAPAVTGSAGQPVTTALPAASSGQASSGQAASSTSSGGAVSQAPTPSVAAVVSASRAPGSSNASAASHSPEAKGATGSTASAGPAGGSAGPRPSTAPSGPGRLPVSGPPSGSGSTSGSTSGSGGTVSVSWRSAPGGTSVALSSSGGGAWLVAASAARIVSAGGSLTAVGVQGSVFGIGPLQVNGNGQARGDSPFNLSWTGGDRLGSGSGDRGWIVVSPGASNPSLRVPLRPYGAPGSFEVYLATIGGSAELTVPGPQGSTRVVVGGCGGDVCPYVVTITLKSTQRIDDTLDIAPTGGGSVGLAAVRQQ